MIKKLTLTIVCLGLLWGCAGTQPQTTFVDNTFTSDLPKLKVRILKNVSKQKEESKQGQGYETNIYTYLTDSGEVVGITIWRFVHMSSKEWRSSNEQLIRSLGMVPIGPISINNKVWVKFADLRHEKNVALFGYFKRMDMNLVAVYCSIRMKEMYKDVIASFKKTRVMTEEHKQIITKAFLYIEQLVVIDSYEDFDKTGFGQTAETEPKFIIFAEEIYNKQVFFGRYSCRQNNSFPLFHCDRFLLQVYSHQSLTLMPFFRYIKSKSPKFWR